MLPENFDKFLEWANKWLLEFNSSNCKVIKLNNGNGRRVYDKNIMGKAITRNNENKSLE